MGDDDKGVANSGPAEAFDRASGVWRRIAQSTTKSFGMLAGLTGPARILLLVAGAILAAFVLLWAVDKIVFYYVAKSYVDEVANALDLNPHLANALVLLTFAGAVFFAQYLWSLSSQKRLIGVAGLGALLIGHSLVLWLATRDNIVDRQGNAAKCYVLSRDGKVSYGERPGVDPATGRQCRPVKPEMVERLRDYEAGKRPQRVAAPEPTFFDQRSGEPIVWYYRSKDGSIEIFDLMGFHPDTGEELLPITKEVAAEWKKQYDERQRRVPKLITNPDKYMFFDARTGEARAWYWVGSNGIFEFYDGPGFHAQTGDKLQVVTRDVINQWQETQTNPTKPQKVPNRVQISADTVFFDPVSGNPRLWYWRRDKGDYEFFDGPGFHPQNGQLLQSFTKDVLTQYQSEIDEKAKQLKAEQIRIEAEQAAKRDADQKRQLEQQQRAEADDRKRAEELQRATEAGRRCDELAANPSDAHRVGPGVAYGALKPQAAEAVDACGQAARQNPNDLRFKYQLGRALELAGDGAAHVKNRQAAFGMHQGLVNAGYAAAFDNLASMYLRDRNDLATAVSLFRKGVELDDSDSMISLGDLIDKGQVMPQNPGETALDLYHRAAELGNQNGIRAYQAALANAQQAQQQQVQQLQQQQMMLQFMGAVLRNIH